MSAPLSEVPSLCCRQDSPLSQHWHPKHCLLGPSTVNDLLIPPPLGLGGPRDHQMGRDPCRDQRTRDTWKSHSRAFVKKKKKRKKENDIPTVPLERPARASLLLSVYCGQEKITVSWLTHVREGYMSFQFLPPSNSNTGDTTI